jgi:hypothetical protein
MDRAGAARAVLRVAPGSGVVGPVWTLIRQALPDSGSAVISTALTDASSPFVGTAATTMLNVPISLM